MLKNFEEETLEAIRDREVDEYCIRFHPYAGDEDEPESYEAILFKGKSSDGKINFEELKSSIGRPNLNYDRCGTAMVYCGWITFKDTQDWISREETYQHNEFWYNMKRPTLKEEFDEM